MTLEKFRPRLKPGQFFVTPMGVVFELDDGSKQVTLPAEAEKFVGFIDGRRSIQEIIEATFRDRHKVPFKALISAIQKLRQTDCFENGDELGTDGEFETRAEIFDQTVTWWEKPIFSTSIVNRLNLMEASTFAFEFFALGSFLLTIAFLGLYLNKTDGRQIFSTSFLRIYDSYLFGVVFFFVATSILVSMKTIFKSLLAVILTGRLGNVRLELNLYSFALRMNDDRLYYSGDRKLAVLSVACVSLSQFFFFAFVKAATPHWSLLADLFTISVILCLIDSNPYRKSELTAFFSVLYNKNSVTHLLPYLKSRALTAAVGKGDKVADEKIYAVYSTLAITWTIFAFNFALFLLNKNYANLVSTISSGDIKESVPAAIVLAGITIASGYLVLDLLRMVMTNLVFPRLTSRISKQGEKKSRVMETHATEEKIELLNKMPLFQYASKDAIKFLLSQSKTRHYRNGGPIIVQGTESTHLFALISGEAIVRKRHPTGGETLVAILRSPVMFGENTLLEETPRSADVIASGDCEAIVIPRQAILDLENDGTLAADHRRIVERLQAGNAISASELFRGAPSEAVSLFLDEGEIVRVEVGTTIIRQRALDKDFYLIIRGSVDVNINGEVVQQLEQGDFFGEMALMFDSPRTATITTKERTTLLKLTQEQFWKVITRHLSLALFLETVSEMRKKADQEQREIMEEPSRRKGAQGA